MNFFQDLIPIKKKKIRQDFWYLQSSDQTLKLYDPYARFSILPGKETFSGPHNLKICLSIGRRYNERKASQFFNSTDPLKEKIAEKLGKESGLTMDDVLKRAKDGTLKNILIDIWGKSAKKLGIPVVILQKKKGFEIYEMFKTNDTGEVAQFVWGSLMALGKAIKLFSKEPEKDKQYWKDIIKKNVDRMIDSSYE